MGVLDKIKNALFEVEYVEVEEPDLKDRKAKLKEKYKDKLKTEKPIAKKIVLPEKTEGRVEEIHEEDLKDDNFEARPKDDIVKTNSSNHENFKVMDEKDFRIEEDPYTPDAKILKMDKDGMERRESRLESTRRIEDKDDFQDKWTKENDDNDWDRNTKQSYGSRLDNERVTWKENEEHTGNYYNSKISKGSNFTNYDSKLYGRDSSYDVPMHEYGTYDKKEERAFFKPSPIISPIYGVLDKNYKKEDVVQKKEIRLTTSYSRNSASVDDIRNKAYASKKEEDIEPVEETKFEVEEEEDENLLVDLSDNQGKPEVKELTMGDALEYFQDLGLEYNVDYVDASKDKKIPKRTRANYEESEETDSKKPEIEELTEDAGIKKPKEKNTTKVVEIKKESKETVTESLDDDDNLFDLIDSMYQEG